MRVTITLGRAENTFLFKNINYVLSNEKQNENIPGQNTVYPAKISILARKKRHNALQSENNVLWEALERVVKRMYFRPHCYDPHFVGQQGLLACPFVSHYYEMRSLHRFLCCNLLILP